MTIKQMDVGIASLKEQLKAAQKAGDSLQAEGLLACIRRAELALMKLLNN